MFPYPCNVKKSPRDHRDYLYVGSSERPVLPSVVDYRPQLQRIRDQGDQGSCYAQAAACMKEWQEKLDEYMSPQFFYNNRPNKYDDDPENDDGMYGRDVMKLLVSIGICRERVYHYGRIEPKNKIPPEIYEEAKHYRIKSYVQVKSIASLKECLWTHGPCLITFPVYNWGSSFWKKQSHFARRMGGHAVTVVGYNEDGFIIRNSWGTKWGDKGYTIYPYIDWGSHWEIWSTVDVDEVYIPPPSESCCWWWKK